MRNHNLIAHCWMCGQDEYLQANRRFQATRCPRCQTPRDTEDCIAADVSDRRAHHKKFVIRVGHRW